MDKIEKYFKPFFDAWNKSGIKYVITSSYRPESKTSYHRFPGMAIDIILNTSSGSYAAIEYYESLFMDLYEKGFRGGCGIDNTSGNIHIHLDARHEAKEQRFFFLEENAKYLCPFDGSYQQLKNNRK